MSVDHIRYDLLVRQALRDVVRRVLVDVAKNGLPGEHHFYISFDTRAPGVRLSPRMRAQYAEEMTIVLQHQFWDLIIGETAFEVGLSFGGIPERLTVPFDALKGFFDPSVQFGLEFEIAAEAAGSSGSEPAAASPSQPPSLQAVPSAPANVPVPVAAKKSLRVKSTTSPAKPAEDGSKPDASPAPIKQDGMGEVVRFDRFRKK